MWTNILFLLNLIKFFITFLTSLTYLKATVQTLYLYSGAGLQFVYECASACVCGCMC